MKFVRQIAALLTALGGGVAAAPVAITPAALTYVQDFDSLGGGVVAWVNDTTIPGWQVQINNGNTATGNVPPADGSTVLSGLLNLGASGSNERALGSKATGTNNLANLAYAVSFKNDGPRSVALTQLRYTGELWRTNSGTGTPLVPVHEEYTVFAQVSAAAVTNILSGATSPNAAPGTGFTALGAAANWTGPVNTPGATPLDGNAAANRTLITFNPAAALIVPPGQHLTLKWTDANEVGTDGFQGLDDVAVTFSEFDGVLTPAVSNIVRHARNTLTNHDDDTFGFTVNVIASGDSTGTGWTTADVAAPNATTADYGTAVAWSGFPVGSAKSALFQDSATPWITAGLSVDYPRLLGYYPPAGEVIAAAGSLPPEWVADETALTLTMNNGGGAPARTVVSAPLDLTGLAGAKEFRATLNVRDTSSGFEPDDTFLAQLILNDGLSDTIVNLTAAWDTDASGAMNGAELAPGGGTVAAPTLRSYELRQFIPAGMVSARLVLSGNNNSPNETFTVAGIVLDTAPRYTIGWQYDGTALTDILSDSASAPAVEWINDPQRHTLDMTTGGTGDKVVISEVLDLTATGTVWFSAVLRARETSTGTNFETTDRFKAELIIDGGTGGEQIINLIAPYDTGDGATAIGGAANGAPNGYLNGYTGTAAAPATALEDYNANRQRDEFNRRGLSGDLLTDHNLPLSAIIPATAGTVQLRIAGAGISGTEFFTVSRAIFSTVSPAHDSDGDGNPDLAELTDGTDPHDAASLFTATTLTSGPGGAQVAGFPTVPGRSYRGYFSTDLATWTRDDSVPLVTGDGTVQTWTLPVLVAPAARHYLKVLVGFTPADFPPTLP